VLGEVTGNVTASDKVDIRDNGSWTATFVSPRVAIAEGAHFRGSVRHAAKRRRHAAGKKAKPATAAPQRRRARAPAPLRSA